MASKQRSGGEAPARMTKAERKQEARRRRIELQRREAARRRNRTIGIAALVVVTVAIVGVIALSADKGGDQGAPRTGPLPGLMTGPQPWPANTGDLAARLNDLSLPPVGGAIHIHSHLDIFVNGVHVPVPANVGISSDAESPLHTHDDTGVVHLESADANTTFTLGEFFDVWGLKLTPSCIGGYCDAGDRSLRIFVNGDPYRDDPRTLRLQDHEEIVITYGTEAQVPTPLPSFDWSKLQP